MHSSLADISASAKNFENVLIVVDPEDYNWIGERLKASGGSFQSITLKERKQLALKAFQQVCSYDAAISQYLARVEVEDHPKPEDVNNVLIVSNNNNNMAARPKSDPLVVRPYEHQFDLKYGVNPHQIPSAIYSIVSTPRLYRYPFRSILILHLDSIERPHSPFQSVERYSRIYQLIGCSQCLSTRKRTQRIS